MRSYQLLLVLAMMTSAQASQAQFNIQTDEGTVTIGGDGINVRHGGETVKINSGGISVRKPHQAVNVRSSKKNGTVSTRVRTNSVSGLSLPQRVAKLEKQAYGKENQSIPLITRVEKLELDTIGAVGTGSISLRVSKLANILDTSESTDKTVVVKSVHVSEERPSIEVNGPRTAVKMDAIGVGADIVLDNSNFDGTVACNGGNVVLNASSCNIKFTGPINALILNGSGNDITCDTVRHVQVNGSANDVKWIRTSNPSVANAGSANTLRSR